MTAASIVLATPHARHDRLEAALRDRHGLQVHRLRHKDELTAARLAELAPRMVFLPHWSWIIPSSVFAPFECVIFHTGDVPFGRGGSPVQNLIARGIYDTQLTALRCVEVLDGGPVYLKRPLSLHGAAEEIYLRAAGLIEGMIVDILQQDTPPVPQTGEPVVFQRRRPADGDIAPLQTLQQVHDFIRMLDAEGYPRAFLQIGALRLEFERARLSADEIHADVRIRLREPGSSA